jgi:hypothetical protein
MPVLHGLTAPGHQVPVPATLAITSSGARGGPGCGVDRAVAGADTAACDGGGVYGVHFPKQHPDESWCWHDQAT